MSWAESRRQQEALDPYSYPDIQVHGDGTRTVRWAGDRIRTRPTWLERLVVDGYPLADVVQADGTLQLDTAGVWRYRPSGQLPDGAIAYERIT